MQKYLDSMHTDQPLQIKSAMCTDVKGYIYLEAYKEKHVRDATQGLNHLFFRIQQCEVCMVKEPIEKHSNRHQQCNEEREEERHSTGLNKPE